MRSTSFKYIRDRKNTALNSLTYQFFVFTLFALGIVGIINFDKNFLFVGIVLIFYTIYFGVGQVLIDKSKGYLYYGLLLLFMVSLVFCIDGYLGIKAGIHLYYFPIILSIPFFADHKYKQQVIVYMAIPLLGMIASIILSQWYRREPFDLIGADTIYYINIGINILLFQFFVLSIIFKDRKSISDVDNTRAQVNTLMENNDIAVCIINKDYQIIESNKRFKGLYQEVKQDLIEENDNFFTLFREKNSTLKWVRRLHKALNGFTHQYIETQKIGGIPRTLEISLFPLVADNEVTGVAFFTKDITGKKNFEEKLKLQNKELKKLNKALDQFVYSASHDLRAPIATLLGLVDLAKRETDIEKIKDCLLMKEKTLQKLDSLIHDIIDYSRNSRLDINNEKIDFSSIITDILELHEFNGDTEKIKTNVNIIGTFPFYSDKKRIKIVLSNLISNAIKYSDYRKDQPQININVKISKKSLKIMIEDNGIGIENEHIGKIFDMFYRASVDRHGPGLGLYIVKETLDKLKGEIEVSSEYGIGSIFTVIIPNQSKLEHTLSMNPNIKMLPIASN